MPADQPPVVETVVVSAARLPAPASDGAFSIVRIDGDQLVLAPRLDDALKQVPGLSLFRRTTSLAANPTTQGVSLRAIAPSGAGRTLVTLDGVPQNDPFGGWVIWSALPVQAIDGVSIVRGAGAGPYGAGALTGAIALDEAVTVNGLAGEIAGGERESLRGAVVADAELGAARLFVTASGERSDGWIPVVEGRGAADAPLHLATWQTSARLQADVGHGVLAMRAAYYDDDRGSGIEGGGARATGDSASITYAASPSTDRLGWRAQVWLRDTDLQNFTTAASVPGRDVATPANDQYATPALGWGANAALRGQTTEWEWEFGTDARFADGETQEHFRFIAPDFTRNRVAGGENVVAGAYGEASWRSGPWLIAGGARLDYWQTSGAHRLERDLATDAVTLDIAAPDRDGVVPTARAGARYDLGEAIYLRAAAYAGFRPPTLNELHRPFRVQNDITEANPLLKPEKLYGVEAALGSDGEAFAWQATLFYNVLKDPITNVTIATAPGNATVFFGPESFEVFVPVGGVLRQRQNAGRINAVGLEAEATSRWGDDFAVRVAANVTSARVDGGDAAPQLTGNRPAQAPRVAITAGADWRVIDSVTLHAGLRFESMRFDDDLNTRELDSAFTGNVRADWRIDDTLALYAEALNVTDADIETAKTADGIASLDQPRTFWIGLTYSR